MKTKDYILKIATEEFSKYGYDAVSMNSLVEKLDINKATVYYHFKDKKSLYHEVLINILDKSNMNMKELFNQKYKKDDEFFKKYIEGIILTIKEDSNIVSLVLREMANYGANIEESFVPFLEEEIGYLKMAVERLALKDKYKNMSIYTLHSFINGTIMSFYVTQMTHLAIGDTDLKQNGEETLDYICKFAKDILLDAIVKK